MTSCLATFIFMKPYYLFEKSLCLIEGHTSNLLFFQLNTGDSAKSPGNHSLFNMMRTGWKHVWIPWYLADLYSYTLELGQE